MDDLSASEISKIQNRILEELGPVKSLFERSHCPLYLAGGSIVCSLLGLPIHDFDIYFSNDPKRFNASFSFLKKQLIEAHAFKEVYDSKNACTLRNNSLQQIQLIKKTCVPVGDPLGLFDNFDLSICGAGVNLLTNRFVSTAWFLESYRTHTTSVLAVRNNAPGTLFRILKYQRRGFQVREDDFKRVLDKLFCYSFEHEQNTRVRRLKQELFKCKVKEACLLINYKKNEYSTISSREELLKDINEKLNTKKPECDFYT